jgi:trigger factor
MGRVQTHVEELDGSRVRLTVDVPAADVKHAVDHAASDLAGSLKIPGFRKGKVPMPVLLARVGKERVYTEAVESHIGGWFWNAAAETRIRPVAQPQYGYDLPASDAETFRFTATVPVQPKPELPDWRELEVPAAEPNVPAEVVEAELEALQDSVAELVPADGRPAQPGDTVVVDLVGEDEAQRDYVVELGAGRLIEELEEGLTGMSAGESKQLEYELADGSRRELEATVKEVKEKVLPPLDDELARAASEFETLAELRSDIEGRLLEQLEEEVETAFRAAAADRLVEASKVDASGPLVETRARELLTGMARSLERRGISLETYIQVMGEDPQELEQRLLAEARQSVGREIVLEAVADQLGLEASDEEVDALIREQGEAAGDDPEETLERIRAGGAYESIRGDLRLRAALDRVASEVKRVPVDLARAREKLWTPEQEKAPGDTKLWTPGTKEPA